MPRRIAQPVSIDNAYLEFSNPSGTTPGVAPAGKVRIYGDASGNLLQSSSGDAYEQIAPAGIDRIRYFEDFLGVGPTRDYMIPLFTSNGQTNQVTVTDTNVISGLFRVTWPGQLIGVAIVGEDTLATSNTNYLTFALTNRSGNASGTTAMLVATDAVTTKVTGGSAWTAKVARTLSLSSTLLDLAVGAGDVLEFTATVSGTLANVVDRPYLRLQFQGVPQTVQARLTRTAGDKAPAVYQDYGTIPGGTCLIQLNASSVNQGGRIDWNGEGFVNASSAPIFRCRVKVSGVSASQAFVFGLCGASSGTFDTHTYNAWFRLEGASLALVAETDDNTTDNDDQATGVTLVADTWYVLEVDMTNLSAVKFSARYGEGSTKGQLIATPTTLSMAAIPANTGVQPVVGLLKTTGAQTDSITVDWWEVTAGR